MSNLIDTSQIYSSGVPAVEFQFNLDGQAYTLDGIPVNGITFGFNPSPPVEPEPFPFSFQIPPGTPVEGGGNPSIPPGVVIVPGGGGTVPTVPGRMDTPEPAGMWLMVGGMILILLSRKLLTWHRCRV